MSLGPRPLGEILAVDEQAYVAIGFLAILIGGERAGQDELEPLIDMSIACTLEHLDDSGLNPLAMLRL
jgi:hypothetical protein